MRFLSKIIITFLLIISILAGFLYVANLGYLNPLSKYIFRYYLKYQGIESEITGFKYKDGILSSDTILIKKADIHFKLEQFKADIKYLHSFYRPSLDASVSVNRLTLFDKEGIEILETDFLAKYHTLLFAKNIHATLNFPNIKISEIKDIEGKLLPNGNAIIEYEAINSSEKHNLNLNFAEKSYLNLTSIIDKTTSMTASMENLPLMLCKIGVKISPSHNFSSFFEEYIKDGFVVKGNLVFNTNGLLNYKTQLTSENLKGNFKVKNLNIQYNKDFPQVKNLDTDVTISGQRASFIVNEAYSSRIKLYDGNVDINWQEIDKAKIIILAKGKGPASDLTDFVPETTHDKLRKSNINLRELKGDTLADIKVTIPLGPDTINTYDISATVPVTGISIFKGQLNLTKTSLIGKFDGDNVIITGKGKINGYNSDLKFNYKVNNQALNEFDLAVKTYFLTNPQKSKIQKIGFLSFLKGNSSIDLSYANEANKGIVKITSDLKDLDLYVDKLGIHKEQGQTGNFILTGEFEEDRPGKIEFDVQGQNNLHIHANMVTDYKLTEIIFSKIKHNKTDLTAKVKLKGELFDGNIKGAMLDLSNANMLQLLGKEREEGATKLKMDVKEVKLKSDILLTDLKLKFECDKDRCTSGYIDSKIGNKSIEVLLRANGNAEEWILNCSNAGALLKGFGAYNSMIAGNLMISLNTSRKEVKPGEIIPILNGNFTFERFVLHNAPTLTRLVSFVSLPGFVGMITNNKDIFFSKMIGNFNFANRSLVISKGLATGPYFDFAVEGNIDTQHNQLKLEGHVKPALYGISKIVGSIPLLGRIITGDKKHGGLITAPFKINQKY